MTIYQYTDDMGTITCKTSPVWPLSFAIFGSCLCLPVLPPLWIDLRFLHLRFLRLEPVIKTRRRHFLHAQVIYLSTGVDNKGKKNNSHLNHLIPKLKTDLISIY